MVKFLIDTNCLSELTKKNGDSGVISWFNSNYEEDLFISVLTVGEIKKGIEKLPVSSKKDILSIWFSHELNKRFKNRIVPFSISHALAWGDMMAKLESFGINLPIIDSMLAAVAFSENLTLVTRNTKDFEKTGVNLLCPWTKTSNGG
jgi:predicted nucleic acid-binding protein